MNPSEFECVYRSSEARVKVRVRVRVRVKVSVRVKVRVRARRDICTPFSMQKPISPLENIKPPPRKKYEG
jgi:hypothetical protein